MIGQSFVSWWQWLTLDGWFAIGCFARAFFVMRLKQISTARVCCGPEWWMVCCQKLQSKVTFWSSIPLAPTRTVLAWHLAFRVKCFGQTNFSITFSIDRSWVYFSVAIPDFRTCLLLLTSGLLRAFARQEPCKGLRMLAVPSSEKCSVCWMKTQTCN